MFTFLVVLFCIVYIACRAGSYAMRNPDKVIQSALMLRQFLKRR